MTDEEFAYIATIRAEPNYRFIQDERRFALKMNEAGLLSQTGRYTFEVTESGAIAFNEANVSCCRLPKPYGLEPLFSW